MSPVPIADVLHRAAIFQVLPNCSGPAGAMGVKALIVLPADGMVECPRCHRAAAFITAWQRGVGGPWEYACLPCGEEEAAPC